MRYALLLLLLFFASTSNAEVISRPVDLTLNEPEQELELDIDNNGTVDLVLFYDVYQDEPFLHVNVAPALQSTNKVVVTGEHNSFGKDLVQALPNQARIYEGSEFSGQIFGNGPLLAQPDFAGSNILEGRGQTFVGFAFTRDGEVHYGWMAVTVNVAGTEAHVSELAYESVAGRGILAGAIPMSVAPTALLQGLRQIGPRQYELNGVGGEVEVLDILGRELLRQGGRDIIDLAAFRPGVYFIRTEQIGLLKLKIG
jgi:hypothetical protein